MEEQMSILERGDLVYAARQLPYWRQSLAEKHQLVNVYRGKVVEPIASNTEDAIIQTVELSKSDSQSYGGIVVNPEDGTWWTVDGWKDIREVVRQDAPTSKVPLEKIIKAKEE